jgi:pimeloyl-ACP methyl ester carboxylesterase
MNEPRLNVFDAGNAARLCNASADAYDHSTINARDSDTHVLITRTDSDLIIAFRGTSDVRNWLTDLDCTWDLEDGCRVHRGFARAVDSVQAQIHAEVLSDRRNGRRIWLAGHSLGGALAMLYAWRFFNLYHELPFAGIYTLGQPRVGNPAFRDLYCYSGLASRTFRIVHADDVIPRIPWLLGLYRHAGHEVFLSGARSQNPEFRVDPSFRFKVPFDVANAWRELRHGRLALVADHHVDSYVRLLRAHLVQTGGDTETSDPVPMGSEAGRVWR